MVHGSEDVREDRDVALVRGTLEMFAEHVDHGPDAFKLAVASLQDHAHVDEVHVQREVSIALIAAVEQVVDELGEVLGRNSRWLLAEEVGCLVRLDGNLDAPFDSQSLQLHIVCVIDLNQGIDGGLIELILLVLLQIKRFLVRWLVASQTKGELPIDLSVDGPHLFVVLDVRPDLLDHQPQQVFLDLVEEGGLPLSVYFGPLEALLDDASVDHKDLVNAKVVALLREALKVWIELVEDDAFDFLGAHANGMLE